MQDELENEVTRLKDRLARSHKKSSKGPSEGSRSSASTASISASSTFNSDAGDVCEFCEQPGHDAFTCDLLRGEGTLSASSSRGSVSGAAEGDELFCEDCEGRGHTAENCPSASDVF